MNTFISLNILIISFLFCADDANTLKKLNFSQPATQMMQSEEDQGDFVSKQSLENTSEQKSFLQQAYPSNLYKELELEDRLKVHALHHKNRKEDAFSHLLVINECNLRKKIDRELKAERQPIYSETEIKKIQRSLKDIDSARASQIQSSSNPEKEFLKRIFTFFNFESKVLSKKNNQ